MPCPNERRKRNKTIAFRATPEENDAVTLLAEAAGMTKQEYIMSKLTDTTVVIRPSTRTIRALKRELAKTCSELERIRKADDMGEELERRVALLLDMVQGLGAEIPESKLDEEAAAIRGMTRG